MKVYVARPITGLAADEVILYYQDARDVLVGMGYEVFHAFYAKNYLKGDIDVKASGYDFPLSKDHAIVKRDHWMTRQADILFVNLAGCKQVSIGCMFEMAWAHHMGKHVVTVMEKGNIHHHAFVLESSDVIYETVHEALDYLEKLARNQI